MPPPPYFNPVLSGICMADGNYAYIPSIAGMVDLPVDSLNGHMVSIPGTNQTYIFASDPRYVSYQPGMAPLFSANPLGVPEGDVWESRRASVLLDLARPFPPEQYELRDQLIRRLQSEGLNARNAYEIGRQLATLGITIPRPPRAQPAAATVVAEPALPRISAETEAEVLRELGRTRALQSTAGALPEIIDVYRFDRTRKIRDARPVRGSAYSPMDRTLIVVDGNPGGTFSINDMNQEQWDAFRSDAVHRGYAVTNPRADGSMRTDARTLEYHIVADSVDVATLRYFRENNPYIRVIRYASAADVAAGRGEVLIDSPRQYLRTDLAAEGTVHDVGDFVEVRNGDTVVRRLPRAQVTDAFFHYLDRLSSDRAIEVGRIAREHGWDLSTMNREQGAELLSILQGAEHRWDLEEIHTLIGSEGMRSFYNYGTSEKPFGFATPEDFRTFRTDVFAALEREGLPISTGEARVILSGSAMSGYSTKGGQFRWNETVDALGDTRAPSDYDIKVVVSREVFNQWVERSLAVLPTERLRKGLRHYIGKTDGLRWAELPPEFRDALRPLMEHYPRIQQVTIALEGGYWHELDPQADAMHIDMTEGLRPAAVVPQPANVAPASGVLLRGEDARPTGAVDRNVVRAQVALRYTQFLSQTAREALQDGQPLPSGNDLFNSHFSEQVDALTTEILNRYDTMSRTEEARAERDRMWREEASGHGFVVRDGVPDGLLTRVAGEYFAREAARTGSPLAGGVGTSFRADGERALETEAYESRFTDMMRKIGR
ncbi:MAG TPA: hypothetical protein VFX30_03770 [bacterium]|nr:hypothetical protein [bacterium]